MKILVTSQTLEEHNIIKNALNAQYIQVVDDINDADSVIVVQSANDLLSTKTLSTKPCFYIGTQKISPDQDIYLKKYPSPLRVGQLIASITKTLKIAAFKKPVDIGEFEFFEPQNRLKNKRTNHDFKLTEKETAIIKCLLSAHPNKVEKENLLEEVWNYAPDVETHTVETHIYRLRQKINHDDENQLIITMDKGYKLNL